MEKKQFVYEPIPGFKITDLGVATAMQKWIEAGKWHNDFPDLLTPAIIAAFHAADSAWIQKGYEWNALHPDGNKNDTADWEISKNPNAGMRD